MLKCWNSQNTRSVHPTDIPKKNKHMCLLFCLGPSGRKGNTRERHVC